MYILIGIIFIGISVIMLANPQTVFEILEGWKYNVYSEPSKLYIYNIRFGGCIFLIIGIASIVIQFF